MKKRRVLFLCTGNSARSQMAEGLVNHFMSEMWHAESAGTAPTGEVHELAIQVMDELGTDISSQRSKSAEEYRNAELELVITVCDDAAQNCPIWLGQSRLIHFGFADPAAESGSLANQLQAFRDVRDGLKDVVLAHLQQITRG